MATNFPTSVDALTNPVSNDSLNSPSHSTQHANANDAIEAIETYLLGGGQGLTLIKKQTIGSAVTSVNVTSAFSATYENYQIIVSGGVGSTPASMDLVIGAASTGYYNAGVYATYAGGSPTTTAQANAAYFSQCGFFSANGMHANIFVSAPFLTKNTIINATAHQLQTTGVGLFNGGYLNNTTSYTDFTIRAGAGNMTGGTIYVYGYGIGQ